MIPTRAYTGFTAPPHGAGRVHRRPLGFTTPPHGVGRVHRRPLGFATPPHGVWRVHWVHWVHRGHRVHRGFTLVEMMVASVVLAFGMMAIARAVSMGLQATRRMADHETAVNLARQQLESLLQEQDTETDSQEGDFGDAYPGFTWTSELMETSVTDLYAIQVTVTYPAGASERHVDITGMFTDHEQLQVVMGGESDEESSAATGGG